MKTTDVLILHCPAGAGHRAAARAVADAAVARGLSVEVLDALELTPPWFARAYVGAHLTSTARAPGLYGASYAVFDQRHPLTLLRGTVDRAIAAPLCRYVSAWAPRAIVATHFFPLAVLGRERRRGRLAAPLVGVVTDYAAHAFWAE